MSNKVVIVSAIIVFAGVVLVNLIIYFRLIMSEPNSMPVSEYGMLDEDIERIPIKDLFKKQRTYTEVTQLLHDTRIASVTFFDWAADQCIITLKD